MARLNTVKTINNAKGRINSHYDLTYDDIVKIEDISKGMFDIICNCFIFGYAQGVKAQKKGCAYSK